MSESIIAGICLSVVICLVVICVAIVHVKGLEETTKRSIGMSLSSDKNLNEKIADVIQSSFLKAIQEYFYQMNR